MLDGLDVHVRHMRLVHMKREFLHGWHLKATSIPPARKHIQRLVCLVWCVGVRMRCRRRARGATHTGLLRRTPYRWRRAAWGHGHEGGWDIKTWSVTRYRVRTRRAARVKSALWVSKLHVIIQSKGRACMPWSDVSIAHTHTIA